MRGLRGYEIAEKISNYSSQVYQALDGIVSIDEISKEIQFHHFQVVNLSPSSVASGSHWIVSNERITNLNH